MCVFCEPNLILCAYKRFMAKHKPGKTGNLPIQTGNSANAVSMPYKIIPKCLSPVIDPANFEQKRPL